MTTAGIPAVAIGVGMGPTLAADREAADGLSVEPRGQPSMFTVRLRRTGARRLDR